MQWVHMRQRVAWLFRYREVSLKANSRNLDALAAVDDPTAPSAISIVSPPAKGLHRAAAVPYSILWLIATLNYPG